jgi:peptidoglycan/LPS O-acetylase OafA/YrhL
MNAPDPVKERLQAQIAAQIPERLAAQIAANPSLTRAAGRKRALLLYALSAATMVSVFLAAGGWGHGDPRPAEITGRLVLGSAVIAVAALFIGLGRGRRMTGRPSVLLLGFLVALPVAAFAWQTHWFGTYTEPVQRFGWRCIGLTFALGGVLLGALVALRRGTVVVSETLHGAAAGAAAGACATVFVDAWCPLVNTVHVAQGHIAPMLVLTLAGAVLGRLLLGLRKRA